MNMKDRLEHAVEYARKLKSDRSDKPGFVYLIECHDFVKAGYADNVQVRLCALQTGNPYELRLLKAFQTDHMIRDEARIHALWKRYEVRGEWFQVPAGELAAVVNAESFEGIFQQ
jgi:hypothetical protein